MPESPDAGRFSINAERRIMHIMLTCMRVKRRAPKERPMALRTRRVCAGRAFGPQCAAERR